MMNANKESSVSYLKVDMKYIVTLVVLLAFAFTDFFTESSLVHIEFWKVLYNSFFYVSLIALFISLFFFNNVSFMSDQKDYLSLQRHFKMLQKLSEHNKKRVYVVMLAYLVSISLGDVFLKGYFSTSIVVIKSGVIALGVSLFLLRRNWDLDKGIISTALQGVDIEKTQQIITGEFKRFVKSFEGIGYFEYLFISGSPYMMIVTYFIMAGVYPILQTDFEFSNVVSLLLSNALFFLSIVLFEQAVARAYYKMVLSLNENRE